MSQSCEKPFVEPWVNQSGWDAGVFKDVKTPCYVVSEEKLEHNLKILKKVMDDSGCKILIAIKGFSMWSIFPLIRKYLVGAEVSSVNEARLGRQEFGGEVHIFSPSFSDDNIRDYIKYGDHIVFNSFNQCNRFKNIAIKNGLSCGLRVNPEHSEVETKMYDPCRPGSHFGVTRDKFVGQDLSGIEGLHFHTLCEMGADALERTLKVFEEKFGKYLDKMKWVNFGGGHHITRDDYDVSLLVKIIKDFKSRYPHLDVYLEPGEAVALNAGVLVATVVDIFDNNGNIAVIDVSATTHMPDVLEMPYLPKILGADNENTGFNSYTLVGPSCLTGDVIGNYSFPCPLYIGQKLVFLNMAIYTMVKNNTFNGINLPSIAILKKNQKIKIIKEFDYKDFKERLS